jgi:hypothetical protein
MGRKLSPDEADVFTENATSLPDAEAKGSSPYGSALQSRIAEALGVSVADLCHLSDDGNDIREVSQDGETAEMALTRDCSDLIEAFVRVADPEERQRLLKMVQDAAQMNRHQEMPGS